MNFRKLLAAGVAVGATMAVLPLAAGADASLPSGSLRKGAPKNIIVMIGDGMGYNAIDHTSMYEFGQSMHQVVGAPGQVKKVGGSPTQEFEYFPVRVPVSTYAIDGSYDPAKAWTDFNYHLGGPTDSSAAGTALAAGEKTYNGAINMIGTSKTDPKLRRATTILEHAQTMGKATGVVSSVPFSHATPAAYVAHNVSRNDYLGIGHEMITSKTNVILSAGHPGFDDSHKALAAPAYKYLSEADYKAVSTGSAGFSYVQSKAEFEVAAAKNIKPKSKSDAGRLFGLAEVGSTLQQGRAGADKNVLPHTTAKNDVPNLATMSKAALNTLGEDKDGFFVMIEGGAIDWAGHANQNTRSIEETQDFNVAVENVIDWVEKNSNWNETLLVVTADHETGYMSGPGAGPNWTEIAGDADVLPSITWHSQDHSNQLVPLFAKGPGAKHFNVFTAGEDPVRGYYIDNTTVARIMFAMWGKKQ